MKKILVPCDGSENALRAVRHAASLAKMVPGVQLELLNVQDPVLLREHAAATIQEIERWQSDEANRIFQPAKQILDADGISYQVARRTGSPAREIVHHLADTHCDAIVMGTRGLSAIAGLMIGSVATKVIHLVDVPVTLIK